MKEKFLIVVCGSTASGKTDLAIKLAKEFNTEIISADARQIFKELNIGTAKPSAEQLESVKHHLVNSHSIHDNFSAGLFVVEAEPIMERLFELKNHAVLCGGSGLYIKALIEGFDEMPEVPDSIRQSVVDDFNLYGMEWLQHAVLQADPDFYYPADKKNKQRLMRALEVFRASGKPFSSFRNQEQKELSYHVIQIGLELDQIELYSRIDQRMDAMIADGLFEEAAGLHPLKHLNALKTVGYQEIFDFMDGQYDKEEAIRLLKRNSRRYAKRQMTWFKKDASIYWFNPQDYDAILSYIKQKISSLQTKPEQREA